MATITSVNPYTGSEIETFTTHTKTEITQLLEKANDQFYTWRETTFSERKKRMIAAASELKKNKQEYAETMTLEIGKPISQSIAEIEKCAWLCEYYAENAEEQLKDEVIKTDAYKSYTSFEPLGVVLAVMPWNYPFWQVFRFAVPALMAGNIGVLKHASNVFGSALNIEKVFSNAGFPKHCFTTLLIGSKEVEAIIENPIIKAVTLTGSGPAGAAVAATAGAQIKKSVLELGGNNALVVFNDCDMDKTIATCVQARYQNTGQSCIAGKRLLVSEAISEEFIEKLLLKVRELKSGDPMDPDTFIGTLAREDLAITIEEQVQKSLKQGAKLELGGNRQGAYFEPTVLSNVSEKMAVFAEETFGPVLSVTTFKDVDEAIALSNNSRFGLGVSLFTKDIEAAEKMAFCFEEGAVFINELVKSDPRLPFGGVKESGYGRELSEHGIKEFLNKKTIYINK
ncbi:NAD-dependent succinate-semialdehyde dehydrogenase [Ulvibacter litoralis]|uniref:Succinate-semialdehyde dehydrogenase / glutarate-semialdehyde dehydrogenase n=1 Tax=Ulvibacter litoralis TaxID=227084 RepID=A0A1G7FCZ4_9FLAO|nr:NAD-dependent succinate-semialdehyde dehydrogenase [Ulvibacter litoralis]GHC51664.1 aldehyde dehydrogenase [Ulvibacter litoralis]SDE73799.1 succinate-semialdehyde dehydrogenase / glutarate-semialdehyde dehydrogenase [Ulvibacter litoralis]